MIPNYNRVAWFYDWLAKRVFGNKLENAKVAHLESLKPGDRILIVGGGSGSILSSLARLEIELQVDFIEISQSMMRRAKRAATGSNLVRFYQSDIRAFKPNLRYDVVFTNFFFDQFNEEDCLNYLSHIKTLCKSGCRLIYADFTPPERIKDKLINGLMYRFFRLTIRLGKVQLINHRAIFLREGFTLVKSTKISSYIRSDIYIII